MSFWEMLGLVSAMATILGVFLTIYAMINNRVLKAESQHTREMLARMDHEHGEILRRIEQGQQEAQNNTAEARREMAEARREMAEAIKYVADLVRAEGDRTRQAVRAPS